MADDIVILANGVTTEVVPTQYIREFWFSGGKDGDATAGTITVLVKGPGSTNFETPSSSTIDIAAPARLEVTGSIYEVQFTVTGFAGTATELVISTVAHTP